MAKSKRSRKGRGGHRLRGGESVEAPARPDAGSLIGRGVGRSKADLERLLQRPEKARRNLYVDTAAPGASATQRRVGYGSSAARNIRRQGSRMTATLEDSRTKPSRKSSRRSSNRSKSGTPITSTALARQVSPTARARRARRARGAPRPR